MACWGALGGGHFKTEEQRANMQKDGRKMGESSETDIKISNALEKIAKRKSTELTSIVSLFFLTQPIQHPSSCTSQGGDQTSIHDMNILMITIINQIAVLTIFQALAYVRHKAPYTYPIIGGRKVSHLKSNIAALEIGLSDAEIDEIENAAPFDVGFPLSFIFQGMGDDGAPRKYNSRLNANDIPFLNSGGRLQVHDRIPRVSGSSFFPFPFPFNLFLFPSIIL